MSSSESFDTEAGKERFRSRLSDIGKSGMHVSSGVYCFVLFSCILNPSHATTATFNNTYESSYQITPSQTYSIPTLVGQTATVTSMSIQTVFKTRLLLSTYRGKVFSYGISGTAIELTDSRSYLYQDCNDPGAFCFVNSVTSVLGGFIAVDAHRILRFDANWNQISTPDIAAQLRAVFGSINLSDKLQFPSNVAVYEAYNSTHISKHSDPLFGAQLVTLPRAGEAVAFVSNTGEVAVFSLSDLGLRQRLGGFVDPVGLAVMAEPAWEEQSIANVFVCDRASDKVYKLNYGYVAGDLASEPMLRKAGVYEGVCKPTVVSVYNRDLLLVSEDCQDGLAGRRVVVLTVDWQNTHNLQFVTELKPAAGTVFLGPMDAFNDAVKTSDFIVYTYANVNEINVASHAGLAQIPVDLQTYQRLSHAKEFLSTCVNLTEYQVLLADIQAFQAHMGGIVKLLRLQTTDPNKPRYADLAHLNATTRTAPIRPPYASIDSKEAWTQMTFDLEYFNTSFFIEPFPGLQAKHCEYDEEAVKGRIYCARIDGTDCSVAQPGLSDAEGTSGLGKGGEVLLAVIMMVMTVIAL